MRDFLDFRTMVISKVIKIIYVVGAIVLILGGLFFMVANLLDNLLLSVLVGFIVVILLGNLIWRIVCEGTMIIFAIHDRLKELIDKTP